MSVNVVETMFNEFMEMHIDENPLTTPELQKLWSDFDDMLKGCTLPHEYEAVGDVICEYSIKAQQNAMQVGFNLALQMLLGSLSYKRL